MFCSAPKVIDYAHNQNSGSVEIPGIDISLAEERAYKGPDFESSSRVPTGVPPPNPVPGQSAFQPGAMFSAEELKRLQDTLKRMEAAKDDPFKQLALAAELRLLQDKQKESKKLTKSIPLTQSQALKKLSDVMSEEQMEQLKREMNKIEKKSKTKEDRRKEVRRPERPSSTRSKHGKSNVQKQIEDSIMSEFQTSPDEEGDKRRVAAQNAPWNKEDKERPRAREDKQVRFSYFLHVLRCQYLSGVITYYRF